MASFNGNIPTPTNGFNLKVDYTTTQDIENNKTVISSIIGYCKRNNSSYYPSNTSKSATIKLERLDDNESWVTVTTLSNTSSYNLNTNNYVQFVSGADINIPHKSDGKQQLRITFIVDGKLSSYYPVGSISSTVELTTIPRASTLTVPSEAYIEGQAVFYINATNGSFSHTLKYSFGDVSGTLFSNLQVSGEAGIARDIPSSFYTQIPNSKSGICNLTLETYSGSTLIGTKPYQMTIKTDEAKCKPVVDGTIEDINDLTYAITNNRSTLIRYLSTAKITGTATTVNSAGSITSITVDGSSNPLEVANVAKNSFTVKAVDSREYPNTKVVTANMIEYFHPTIKATIKRQTQTSDVVNYTLEGKIFKGTILGVNNAMEIHGYYRVKGTTDWQNAFLILVDSSTVESDNSYTISGTLASSLDYKTDYEFKIVYSDLFEQQTNTEQPNILIDLYKGFGSLEVYEKAILANGHVLFYWD